MRAHKCGHGRDDGHLKRGFGRSSLRPVKHEQWRESVDGAGGEEHTGKGWASGEKRECECAHHRNLAELQLVRVPATYILVRVSMRQWALLRLARLALLVLSVATVGTFALLALCRAVGALVSVLCRGAVAHSLIAEMIGWSAATSTNLRCETSWIPLVSRFSLVYCRIQRRNVRHEWRGG